MNIVTGTVEKVARNGGIMVNGEWYSSFKGKDTSAKGVVPGTFVSFQWTPDTKGLGYKNIKMLTVTGGAAPDAISTTTASVPVRAGNTNLGVELGHASKLAMDMALAQFAKSPDSIGDEAFFKQWITYTDKVYKAMAALRKAKDKPVEVDAPKKAEPLLANSDDEPF